MKRVPVWTQVTQTECGLSCCMALLQYHGRYEELADVREDYEAGRDGLSIKQLKQLLESRGMETKVFGAGGIDALRQFDHPVILYWANYHFVILESIGADRAQLMDPAVGRRRVGLDELGENFSHVVLDAWPSHNFVPIQRPRFREWRQPKLKWSVPASRIVLAVLLTLTTYGITSSMPLFVAAIVDNAEQWFNGPGMVAAIATAVVLVGVTFWLIGLMRAFLLARVMAVLGRGLMTSLFRHMLDLPMKFFSTRTPGELMFRLSSTNSIRDALSTRLLQGILDAGLALVLLISIFNMSATLAGAALSLVLLMLVFLTLTRRQLSESLDAEIAALSEAQTIQYDAVASMNLIKMGGYAKDFHDRWFKQYDKSLNAMERRMRLQTGWISASVGAMQFFSPVILLVLGAALAGEGVLTLGEVVAVQGLSAMLFGLTESAFRTYGDYLQVSRYMVRLTDITGMQSESRCGTVTSFPDTSIDVRGVSFQYTRQSPEVLSEVSFSVEAGQTVSIVGQSGSGKSTLAKVLCGLYEPTAGQVRIGGLPLSEYDLDAIRPQIGYVPQEISLHNGTILENLQLGNSLSDDEALEFCRSLGFLGFIDEMPMQYRTMVSDLGANFSGGQRQRLAIARALAHRPRILIMDEATSALDTINEVDVSRVLEALGCTAVILAHRLETIRNSDRIVVLANGRVVENGHHDELLAANGHYFDLYATGGSVL